MLHVCNSKYLFLSFADYFKAAHDFAQSNMSGSWLWNLLGRFESVLQRNEPLDYNPDNECHILFVSVIVIFNFLIFNFFYKCLPETPFFTTGPSHPPSTHLSGSTSHHGISESYSRPATPMDGHSKHEWEWEVDTKLLGRLKVAGLEVDESLCWNLNPTLQVMYRRYVHANEIYAQVTEMVNEQTWPAKLGKAPNFTDIIRLFVARTTWHNSYKVVFPCAEGYKDMLAWLEEDADCKSDLELWGVVKPRYTLTDLTKWITKQKGKKTQSTTKSTISTTKPTPKSATKSAAKSTIKGGVKGKGKEKEQPVASGSGVKKGKEKEVVQEKVNNKKKSHKKKEVASTSG